MRGSSLKILEHWAIHESPILPFLAPAIFAPWLYSSQHQSAQPIPLEVLRPPPGCCNSTARANTSTAKRSSFRQYEHQAVQKTRRIHNVTPPPTTVGRRCFSSSNFKNKENCVIDHASTADQIGLDMKVTRQWEDYDRNYNVAGEAVEDLNIPDDAMNRTEKLKLGEERKLISLERIYGIPDEERVLRQRLEELRLRASLRDNDLSKSGITPGRRSNSYNPIDSISAPLLELSPPCFYTKGIARLTTRLNLNPPIPESVVYQFGRQKEAWIDSLPPIGSTPSQIKIAWRSLSRKLRIRYWPVAMLFYLEQSTAHALTFLNATIMEPLPLPFRVSGSIHLIGLSLRKQADEASSHDRLNFVSTIEKVFQHYKAPPRFTHRSLRLMLRFFPERAESFLSMLQNSQVQLHHNLLLRFATTFANSGKLTQAVDALKQAVASGANKNSRLVLRFCSRLLRLSRGEEGNYQTSSSIVAALFDMEIPLNIVMFNTLLLNASEAGDPGTAWGIYEMIRKNYMQPDEYTYTIMMKMCRKANQKQHFRCLYYELDPEHKEIKPFLVTEILACRHHFNVRSNFDHVLRFYERHCDLQPLQDLGIVAPDHQIRNKPLPFEMQGPRPPPCAGTLSIMLLAFMKRSQKMPEIERIYGNFQRLLKEGDPCILPLVATTHTYHVFLKAYCSSSSSLARWRDIVRDMVQPLPLDLHNRETGMPLKCAPPEAQTWNIILNGLSRAGQHADAAQLLKVMEGNGMKPDIVTWNSLLSGLARQQRSFNVAGVLQKMEQADERPDRHTRQALLQLSNQARLARRFRSIETSGQDSDSQVAESLVRDVYTDRNGRRTGRGFGRG